MSVGVMEWMAESRTTVGDDLASTVCETPARHPGLYVRFRAAIRFRHLSPRTEKAYAGWIRSYLTFHGGCHPEPLGPDAVTATFLSHLATGRHVPASTQNQALAALLFLYRDVLQRDLPWLDDLVRARRPSRLPVVFDRVEFQRLLAQMADTSRLQGTLRYGAGLRLLECCRLRVNDVDLPRRQRVVREGTRNKDRVTIILAIAIPHLQRQLAAVRELHALDLHHDAGWIELPRAFGRKSPTAGRSLPWQWLSPATRIYRHPEPQQLRRHHRKESVLQRTTKLAAAKAGLTKHDTAHTLRHSFATNLLEAGYDVRTVQELVGHNDVATNMIYAHVLQQGPGAARSPAALLQDLGDTQPPFAA